MKRQHPNKILILNILRDKEQTLFGSMSYPGIWCPLIHDFVFMNSAGWASSFRGLERAGLIERPKGSPDCFRYYYKITESGMMYHDDYLSKIEVD
jgi:hypothetical protein